MAPIESFFFNFNSSGEYCQQIQNKSFFIYKCLSIGTQTVYKVHYQWHYEVLYNTAKKRAKYISNANMEWNETGQPHVCFHYSLCMGLFVGIFPLFMMSENHTAFCCIRHFHISISKCIRSRQTAFNIIRGCYEFSLKENIQLSSNSISLSPGMLSIANIKVML